MFLDIYSKIFQDVEKNHDLQYRDEVYASLKKPEQNQ